jgi:hypothetical protein
MTEQTCKTCKFWDQKEYLALNFGTCTNPNVYSWVRGQSFEPPSYFGCINWSDVTDIFISENEKDEIICMTIDITNL